jgi:hypothetical protein
MVWADTAEQLRQELTDKYVVVMEGVPELKRFAGRTGTVKTVNMNGRALVQFEAPADISWYDIDPSYLTVIDAPLPKKEPATPAAKPDTAKPAATKPAAKGKGGLSPLEMARQQGAAGAGGSKPAPPADGGKKLSPLELARQQGAAKEGGAASAPAEKTPAAPTSQSTEKLSPLELARQQGAAKPGGSAPAAAEPKQKPAAPAGGGEKLSPLELARQQGAAKPATSGAVEEQTPAPEAQPEATTPAETPAAEEPKPAVVDTSGMSKLELARMQGPFKG